MAELARLGRLAAAQRVKCVLSEQRVIPERVGGVESAPRLIAITDSEHRGWAATTQALRTLCVAARPGTLAVLLREPETSGRTLLYQAEQLRQLTANAGQYLLLRDRLDVALWVKADGVHLGEQSVAACDIRAALSVRDVPLAANFWITRAWHDVEQRTDPDVSALVVAPVAASRKGRAELGAAGLAHAVSRAKGCPVYALGGIGAREVPWVLNAGATGIAAIGSAYSDPLELVAALSILRS